MVEIIATHEFRDWYWELSSADANQVGRMVDLLAIQGVALGYPQSSDIRGARYAFRELRIQSSGRPLRVFCAFDPLRQAVLLLGGDKTGDDGFYATFVPRAERIWEKYLAEIGQEKEER